MKKVKKLPKFKNRAEEAEFWDSHDFSDFWAEAEPIDIEFLDDSKKEELITIRVQPNLKKRLEKTAKRYGLSLSTLTRLWLIEKLAQSKG